VNLHFLAWAAAFVNPPIQAIGDATGIVILQDFTLVNYNFLIFGVILAVMMVKRPEGLFPVETAKAEMHGVGIAAELTGGGEAELATAEEVAFEQLPELADEGGDPTSAAGAALMADTPPDVIRDHDLPEDTR
jgi:hypothetical protein